MTDCAIYVRISADKTGRAEGVDRQEAECRQVAERQGWTVVRVYSDNDISAYSGRVRPGYRALCQDMRDGKVQGVVAWHVDRLHRRLAELIEFITLCQDNDVTVQTARSGQMDLSTPTGRSHALIGAVLAQQEVEHGIERMVEAKRVAASEGKYLGGPRPFGFKAGGIDLDRVEAEAIRDATRRVLNGASLASICRRWNGADIKTVRGNTWKLNSLAATLKRPRNAGKYVHKGKIIGVAKSEPIVDEADWLGLCAILDDPARRTSLSNEWRWQGAGGAYRCGTCSGKMRVSGSSGHSKAYRCIENGCVSRKADDVDEYVSAIVVGVLSKPDAVSLFVAPTVEIDVPTLSARKKAFEARAGKLGEMFAADEIGEVALRRGTAHCRSEIEKVDAELATARETGVVESLVLAAEGVPAAWKALPPEARSRIIIAIADVFVEPCPLGRRKFDPDYIRIDWKTSL